MKILAISSWFPYPPDNGSKMRAYHLLHHIGYRHDLDLIVMAQSDRDMQYMPQLRDFCRRVAVFPEPEFHPEDARTWIDFLSPVPRYFRAHHSPELQAQAVAWAEEEVYDALLAVTLGAAPYAVGLKIPLKLLDQHNVESQVIKRRCRNDPSMLRKIRYGPTWRKAEHFERAIASEFDIVTVVSDAEKALMKQLLANGARRSVQVVPNGIDPGLLKYNGPAKDRRCIVFTGGLAYRPNFDAAMSLCRDILPRLRAEHPDVRLQITGRTEGASTDELTGVPGVELTGYVDDIRPIVARASVLVAPLREGGGTRLKILEAMALGTPVVSTPTGAEGLDVHDGVNILLGESNDQLARQTAALLADPGLSAHIAVNAKNLVRERYQWPDIAERFESILTEGDRERLSHG